MNAIAEKLRQRVAASGSMLCVGLDPELTTLPPRFRAEPQPLFAFSRWIAEQTAVHAAAFKVNAAFFEAHGASGASQLQALADFLHGTYPEIVTICDAKRGDNANTNRGYVRGIFDELRFDAVTLHPYLGSEALAPFLERDDKACIVLCRTSNAGAGEVQDLVVEGEPLWLRVARMVAGEWDRDGNCMLVVGATWPEEMRRVREAAPRTMFLVPGVGAQGGDVRAVIAAGLDGQGGGLLISSSRGVMLAEDPRAAAGSLNDEIAAAREACLAAR